MRRVSLLLKQLNKPLHSFFVRALVEVPQLIPPSDRESVEHGLADHSLLGMSEESALDMRHTEEEKIIYSPLSYTLSRDVLALSHFYQVSRISYQPQLPYLSRCLLPENKEKNALSHFIKTSHFIFEAGQLLFLLIKHGQILLILQEEYACLNPEKKYMLFMADILWYRSVFWILIHCVVMTYFIKTLLVERQHIQHLIHFIQSNKNITHKIKSILLARCSEMTPSDTKENFLLVSCMISSLSIKENKTKRDYLSWFDDMCHAVLPGAHNKKYDSMDRLNQIYHLASTVESHFRFDAAHYFAESIVKVGLMTLLMQTVLSPKNYSLDMINTSSHQLSYGFLPWVCREYFQSNVNDFSAMLWMIPILYYLELQLWVWFLIPLMAGLIDVSIINNMTENAFPSDKENFRKNLIDNLQAVRGHFINKAGSVDDYISPEEEAKKIYLIDRIITAIQLHFQKASDSDFGISQRIFQLTDSLQNILYQSSRTTCQFLKMAYSVITDVTFFLIISIIEHVSKNRCTRIHNATCRWKENYFDRLDQSKVSNARASFFSSQKRKKDTTLTSGSSFRPRVHFH